MTTFSGECFPPNNKEGPNGTTCHLISALRVYVPQIVGAPVVTHCNLVTTLQNLSRHWARDPSCVWLHQKRIEELPLILISIHRNRENDISLPWCNWTPTCLFLNNPPTNRIFISQVLLCKPGPSWKQTNHFAPTYHHLPSSLQIPSEIPGLSRKGQNNQLLQVF